MKENPIHAVTPPRPRGTTLRARDRRAFPLRHAAATRSSRPVTPAAAAAPAPARPATRGTRRWTALSRRTTWPPPRPAPTPPTRPRRDAAQEGAGGGAEGVGAAVEH